ncbi:MAG TPA: HEAT repeat domain-containing protein, partial [Isosphaeraceae bacterium]|nr:HEAT repeat domain-containing protein [Isosphaeraceae bacterium]
DEDFVSSPDLDFHPTDVIEDADGSLVIVDTGGWYKLCCPTSQLQKPDVLGAIYRVKRRGAPEVADLWGKNLWARFVDPLRAMPSEAIVKLLDDPRPAVQRHMIDFCSSPGRKDAILAMLREVVPKHASSRLRCNTVWALARIDDPGARALVRAFLNDSDETVRQVALHVTSLGRDRDAVPRLVELLQSSSLPNRHAAVEALGRIGDPSAVPALLKAAGEVDDRILEHSCTYALIEIGDPKTTVAGLASKNDRTKKAALVALDQMDGGGLDPKFVAALLASPEPDMKETASWIIGRHVDWAVELAGVLGERLWRIDLPPAERTDLERQLGRFAQAAPIQRLLAVRLRDAFAGSAARRSSLQAMAWSNLKAETVPHEWVDAVAGVLEGDPATPELVAPAVATLRALPLTKKKAGDLPDRLLRIAGDTKNGVDLRLQALAAVPGGVVNPDQTLVDFLVKELDRDRPVAARTTAADVLARAKLTAVQLVRLADLLPTAGPLEVDRLLTAFEQSTDEALGLKLVENLSKASALSSLRIDSVKASLAKYGPSVRKEAQALYTRLNVDLAKQKEKLEQLMTTLSAGDVRRGQLVFHSEKAACYSCHAIGYRGGNVGPDLTKIGSVRADRDLLEAIVFPSASFVRSFEPIAVATNDGKVFNGLLRGETADELILATGVNQETRVTRRDIEELRPGTLSVMPAGLEQQLTPQELADLVAFLRACK